MDGFFTNTDYDEQEWSFGELTVRRSSFSANRAGLGGAFYLGTGVRGEGGWQARRVDDEWVELGVLSRELGEERVCGLHVVRTPEQLGESAGGGLGTLDRHHPLHLARMALVPNYMGNQC